MRKIAVYILLLVILPLIVLYPYLNPNTSKKAADWRLSHENTLVIMHRAMHKYHTFPFWEPTSDSGMPFFGVGIGIAIGIDSGSLFPVRPSLRSYRFGAGAIALERSIAIPIPIPIPI